MDIRILDHGFELARVTKKETLDSGTHTMEYDLAICFSKLVFLCRGVMQRRHWYGKAICCTRCRPGVGQRARCRIQLPLPEYSLRD